jgi:hypothetical protein
MDVADDPSLKKRNDALGGQAVKLRKLKSKAEQMAAAAANQELEGSALVEVRPAHACLAGGREVERGPQRAYHL